MFNNEKHHVSMALSPVWIQTGATPVNNHPTSDYWVQSHALHYTNIQECVESPTVLSRNNTYPFTFRKETKVEIRSPGARWNNPRQNRNRNRHAILFGRFIIVCSILIFANAHSEIIARRQIQLLTFSNRHATGSCFETHWMGMR